MTEQGLVERAGGEVALVFRRRLPQPVDVVWAALTEPKHVEQWFSRAEIDGREGGEVWFAGPKDRPVSGRILV